MKYVGVRETTAKSKKITDNVYYTDSCADIKRELAPGRVVCKSLRLGLSPYG